MRPERQLSFALLPFALARRFGNAESGIAVGSGLNHKAERGQGESGHQNEAGLAARQSCIALSGRRIEVLGVTIEGLTKKQIARAIDLSPRTVEIHRVNPFDKLATPSLAPLIRRWAALVEAGDA